MIVTEAATNTDMMESLIVYHHLKEVSPKLAEKLSVFHTFPLVSSHLKKVSPELVETIPSLPNINNKPDTGKPANKKTRTVVKIFTL